MQDTTLPPAGGLEEAQVMLGARSRRVLSQQESQQIQASLQNLEAAQSRGLAYQEQLDEAAERAHEAEEAEDQAQREAAERAKLDEEAAKGAEAEALGLSAKGQADVPTTDASRSSSRPHILKFGLTKARPCPADEDCYIHTMTNQHGNLHPLLVTQLNRGRLGFHMFQWAALLSVTKELNRESQFRVVIREGEYDAGSTLQMSRLRSITWSKSDFDFLQKSKEKCHLWDKMPLVIDSGMPRLQNWTAWGAPKGLDHTLANFQDPDDGNLAAAVAQAMLGTPTPHHCHVWELDGLWRNQGFFRHHINLVRLAFWDESSAVKAEDTLRWLLWNEKGAAVGIHIRVGDYNFTGRNLPLQYYSDALAEVQQRVGNESLTCVVFSDNMDIAMRRSKKFDLCKTRIPMLPGFSEQKTFFMMSLMPNIIIADSTYSFWAARISPNDPLVIAPGIHFDAHHLQQEYEYLVQTPGWVTVDTTLGPVGPLAKQNFDEAVTIVKEVPSGFIKLGSGYCSNGYYAGHIAADAMDLHTCAMKCQEESRCMFFALQKGRTCSRYSNYAGDCDLSGSRGQETHTTFAKMSDDNVAMRGVVELNLEARKSLDAQKTVRLLGRNSADELTIEEVSQLEGYVAPASEWAY